MRAVQEQTVVVRDRHPARSGGQCWSMHVIVGHAPSSVNGPVADHRRHRRDCRRAHRDASARAAGGAEPGARRSLSCGLTEGASVVDIDRCPCLRETPHTSPRARKWLARCATDRRIWRRRPDLTGGGRFSRSIAEYSSVGLPALLPRRGRRPGMRVERAPPVRPAQTCTPLRRSAPPSTRAIRARDSPGSDRRCAGGPPPRRSCRACRRPI